MIIELAFDIIERPESPPKLAIIPQKRESSPPPPPARPRRWEEMVVPMPHGPSVSSRLIHQSKPKTKAVAKKLPKELGRKGETVANRGSQQNEKSTKAELLHRETVSEMRSRVRRELRAGNYKSSTRQKQVCWFCGERSVKLTTMCRPWHTFHRYRHGIMPVTGRVITAR